jgi:phosphatidylglycerophosphatase C
MSVNAMPLNSRSDPLPVVAAFDFDGTLTRRDTLIPYLARGLGWPRLLLAFCKCSPWLAGYAVRWVANDVAKAKLLRATLSGRSVAEMEGWTTRWLAKDFPGQLQSWAMARLAWHQQAGHCCVMVSASPDLYLERVAAQLGFDGLICTELQLANVAVSGDQSTGYLTGEMQTPNCHGEQKVLRLKSWLDQRFGAGRHGVELYAYGDTSGDLPLLRMAQHAWYRSKPWKAAGSREND